MSALVATIRRIVLRIPMVRSWAVGFRSKLAQWALRVSGGAGSAVRDEDDDDLEVYKLRSALHRAVAQAARERDRRLDLQAQLGSPLEEGVSVEHR